MGLERYIRNIPDFPKPGIIFRDITTLLQEPEAFKATVDEFVERYKNQNIDVIAAIESRGFIFGGAIAYLLGSSFVPIRKKGKLPWKTISAQYELEYGVDELEIHTDAVKSGQRVLLFDDLIATGGTLKAACELIEKLGGEVVEVAVVIELVDLKGREKIAPKKLFSLIKFEGE